MRKEFYRQLPRFVEVGGNEFNEILFAGLGDDDEKIVTTVRDQIKRSFDGSDEFKEAFFNGIETQKPKAQAQMVDLVRESMTFDEESAQRLVPVLTSAFKTCVKPGLELFRKNKRLLSEETWKPLVDKLIDRLDRSLDSQFAAVVAELLPAFLDNTRAIGPDAAKRLTTIIGAKVLPKWEQLPAALKLELVQRITELARDAEDATIMENLYNQVFLSIDPNASSQNFSILEATLFAFMRLAKMFPNVASNLVGTQWFVTGQPGESEGVHQDPKKYNEFKVRIEKVKELCEPYIERCEMEIKAVKGQKGEEASETFNHWVKARKCAGNTRKLCTLFLKDSPLLCV